MSVLLVLGASGFIGRPVTEALQALGDVDVVGAGLGVPPAGLGVDWLEVDLADESAARLADRIASIAPAAIVNAAGATIGTAGELARANVLATARLLDAIELTRLVPRLVHIGSSAEYGRGSAGTAVREADCARPLGPYGATKLAATQMVANAAADGRIEGVVLRVFNPLGARMPTTTLAGVALARLVEAVRASSGEIRLGALGSVRDFVDVRDVAAAVAAASTVPQLQSPIMNIGSGTGHTARELVMALADRLGFRGRIDEGVGGSPRSTDVPWQVADNSLARAELGWAPLHDLASSVDRLVRAATA